MNNKLKLGVLLLVIVLMFQNCQNDDDLLTTKINSQTSYKRVSLDQVLKLKPIVENIKKVRPLISNIDSRTGETFLGLDNVLTDNIIQITNTTNVSTYTFGIDTNFETTGYIENLHLVETGQDYIAYIIRYIPDLTWATNPDNYTPEGDLVLDLATFQGDKIKYTLDREEIWTTIPPGNARGAWIEECSFSLAETCDYGSSLHVRGPECGGNFGVGIVETCVSVYTGGGLGNNPGDGYNDPGNGGGNTSNNNCEEVIGTLIQDSQPISGMNTGCTTNDTTGVIVVDVINFATSIIDCINGTGQMDDVMLSKNMTIWLYQNQENLEVLNLFLINNGCSEEAQEFGIAAIEALAQDGEVDFEDQIIKHPSFVGSKADCVYEALINLNNNIFKNVINYFTDYRAEFKLKLEISSVSVGAEAQTNYDETTGIITIVFPQAINGKESIEIVSDILHESIHAEIRRIVEEQNGGVYPYSEDRYNYLLSLIEFDTYGTDESFDDVSNLVTHQFMVYYHVLPIAEAVRAFDNNSYEIDYYMSFGWDGLSSVGKNANLVTQDEITNYINLSETPKNDEIKHNCDQ